MGRWLSERTVIHRRLRREKVSVSRMYTRANQERVDEREVEMQGDDLECAP